MILNPPSLLSTKKLVHERAGAALEPAAHDNRHLRPLRIPLVAVIAARLAVNLTTETKMQLASMEIAIIVVSKVTEKMNVVKSSVNNNPVVHLADLQQTLLFVSDHH